MVTNEKELIERNHTRHVWQETLDSVKNIKNGKVDAAHTIELPAIVDVRQKVSLIQSKFAELLGISIRTLPDWEQGRRQPSRAAALMIQISRQRPDALREVFGEYAGTMAPNR